MGFWEDELLPKWKNFIEPVSQMFINISIEIVRDMGLKSSSSHFHQAFSTPEL